MLNLHKIKEFQKYSVVLKPISIRWVIYCRNRSRLRSNSEIEFCLVNLLVRSRNRGVECGSNPNPILCNTFIFFHPFILPNSRNVHIYRVVDTKDRILHSLYGEESYLDTYTIYICIRYHYKLHFA